MRLADAKPWAMRRAAWLSHRLWWTRAMTLGVRAVVLDARGLFLVRHTYVPGWYLPGGAVDHGESAEAAVVRELREEGGILCTGRPELLGLYKNRSHSRRDHVACYIVRQFEIPNDRKPDWEIADSGFFPLDALPDGVTASTRARLAELLDGQPRSETW